MKKTARKATEVLDKISEVVKELKEVEGEISEASDSYWSHRDREIQDLEDKKEVLIFKLKKYYSEYLAHLEDN